MRTYVVRLPLDAGRGPEPWRLRGVVDDVATGQRTTFTSDAELLRVLHVANASEAPREGPPDQPQPIVEEN